MPIVFEEVTGEIVPERDAPAADTASPQTPDDMAQTVRRELSLLAERQRRLQAD